MPDVGSPSDRPNHQTSDDARWVAAGLLDPASPTADERRELLVWLDSLGIPVEQMVAACAEGQLASLPGDLALRPGARVTLTELAARTGMDPDEITRVRRASGFPRVESGAAAYTDDDVVMLELYRLAATMFSGEELFHFLRVVGTSMRRIAEAAGEMFLRDVEGPQVQGPHVSELGRARTSLDGIELGRAAAGLFEPMFRAHMELAVVATRRARAGHDDYSTVPLTVGFVDLTGFTERAGRAGPDELLRLVQTFESLANDLVIEHGGRLVKLIGDEVMFVTIEPGAACEIAGGLVHAADTDARGGLAHGEVVASGGDLYGPVVNLASRITDLAIPGEVLVNEAVMRSVTDRTFEPAGRRALKGFAEPVRLWSLAGA